MRRRLAAAPTIALALAACAATGRTARAHAGLEAEPRFAAETLAGEEVEIGGPGPVRLVELWASWCAPCVPAAEKARAVLRRHPEVLAYALSLDVDREALDHHLARAPPAGTPLLFHGGPAAAARRGLNQLPMFIVLDARGRVAGTLTGLTAGLGPALERLVRQAEGSVGERRE
jgi:thiol-disulfide isomerase/thioredoxin